MTLARYLEHQLHRAIKRCEAQQQICRKQDTPDAVHDLRVCCRRVLEPLRVFEEQLRPEPMRPTTDALRDWMRLSSAVRDLDIGVDLVRRSGLSDLDGPVAVLSEKREQRARKARRKLAAPIPWPGKDDIRGWLRSTKRSTKEGLWDMELSAEQNAALALPMLLERYALRGDSLLARNAPREEFHRFRLRTKRVRYAAEWFVDLFPDRPIAELAAHLHQLQQCLGELQDSAATLVLVEHAGVRKRMNSENSEKLRVFLDVQAEIALQRFAKEWMAFREEKGRLDLRQLMRGPVAG